jgi:hypothetical protein
VLDTDFVNSGVPRKLRASTVLVQLIERQMNQGPFTRRRSLLGAAHMVLENAPSILAE